MGRVRNAVVFTTIVAVSLSVAALAVSGCGEQTETVEETSGRPLVINFWQPG